MLTFDIIMCTGSCTLTTAGGQLANSTYPHLVLDCEYVSCMIYCIIIRLLGGIV